MNNQFSQAIHDLETIVGAQWVSTKTLDIHSAETATFKTEQEINAIVQPKNAYEVSACMKIANKYCLPDELRIRIGDIY